LDKEKKQEENIPKPIKISIPKKKAAKDKGRITNRTKQSQ